MTQQLTIIENPTAITVFDSNKVDDLLKAVREEALSLVADVSTKKGRDELKSQAYKVSQTKTHLVKLANASIKEHKEIVSAVTSERVRLENEMDAIRDEAKRPAVEWEAKEDERKAAIEYRIAKIKHLASDVPNLDLNELRSCIATAHEIFDAGGFSEFQAEAQHALDVSIKTLKNGLIAREKIEAEQAELKKLREEKAKRDTEEAERKAEEARKAAALIAEKAAKEKAEREAKEAKERDELEAKAAAEAKKRHEAETARKIKEAEEAAAKRERDRIAEEARKKKEVEEAEAAKEAKRQANQNHRNKVRKEAENAIAEFYENNPKTESLVTAIERGEIPHVTLNF